MDLIYGTSAVNLQKWFMQAGEPTSSWSGTFLSKQRIASLINLFATDVTSPKTVKAAKLTLWPDLHRETLDQTWVSTSNIGKRELD